jgi:4,5-dihydroxyphthalate decarboxylase
VPKRPALSHRGKIVHSVGSYERDIRNPMTDQKTLSMAIWRYDRTQALYDGRVKIPGYDLDLTDAPLEEIFTRAFVDAEFDVSELSFSNFLRLSAVGKCPYVGIPIFPSRAFRHSAFYIRADAGIASPADLKGRRIGVREFSMTAALAARGALRDQFGIEPDTIEWIVGDVDERERDTIEQPALHKPIAVSVAPEGKLLSQMLLAGELDAILAYKPIVPFKKKDPRVTRLFADHQSVEQAYYRQTGMFPIMHLMALRRDLAETQPAIGRAIFDTLKRAHDLADEDLHTVQALKIGLPWIAEEVTRTTAIMGENFWPEGFGANRAVLQRMIDWSYADGLIAHPIEAETLFMPSLIAT